MKSAKEIVRAGQITIYAGSGRSRYYIIRRLPEGDVAAELYLSPTLSRHQPLAAYGVDVYQEDESGSTQLGHVCGITESNALAYVKSLKNMYRHFTIDPDNFPSLREALGCPEGNGL